MSEESGPGPFAEKDYTLVFCRRIGADGNREILLGIKKRGFGMGKWNGFGGKLEGTETIEEGAIRELEEECGIKARSLSRLGYLCFKMLELSKIMRVHVFESWDFEGDAVESEEMRPQWYPESGIPFDKMWPDDAHWFPFLLEQKRFIGRYNATRLSPISLYISESMINCPFVIQVRI